MSKPIVYIDMDGVLCDFDAAYEDHVKGNPKILYPQATYGFFTNLLPMPGALKAMFQLRKSDKFDLYILTAPSIKNPLCYTEKRLWVEEYLGMDMVENLIISPHKGLLKGDYLIDDNTEGKGQDAFEGELIHFGSTKFPDWVSVLNYLEIEVN